MGTLNENRDQKTEKGLHSPFSTEELINYSVSRIDDKRTQTMGQVILFIIAFTMGVWFTHYPELGGSNMISSCKRGSEKERQEPSPS